MRLIVAPNSPASAEVLERLRSWSSSGLLNPFCWWEAEDDQFKVAVVRDGELEREHLSHALERADPGEVRLIGFITARRDEAFDAEFAERLERRAADAAQVLAFRPGQPLRPAIVVAPAAVGQRVPPGLFRSGFVANILLAPEDRRSPLSANVLADTSEVLPAHGAHGLATLCDLWVARRRSPGCTLDVVAPSAHGPHPVRVVLARCYTRLIDLGFLPDHLAADVFQRDGDGWPNPNVDQFQRLGEPEEMLDYITRRYLRKHADVLGRTPFDPIKLPPRPELTILEALRWIWQQFIRALRRKPYEVLEGMLEWTVNQAAERIERTAGADRPFDVGRWRERAATMTDTAELLKDLERPLTVPSGRIADTWDDFLRLHFGLVDGAALPEHLDADALKLDERRLVVTTPAAIVPDPLRVPPADADGHRGRACDPRFLRRLRRPPEPAADHTEEISEIGEDQPTDLAPAPSIVGPEWAGRYRHVPAWMIGESIVDALEHAEAMAKDPPPAPPSAPGEAERRALEEAKQQRRTRRRARLRLILGLATRFGLAGAASAAAWLRLSLVLAGVAQAGIVALLVVSLLLMARRRWRARQARAREQMSREIAQLNEALERALCKADVKRLRVRYDEYLDWAEIVGWFIHRPWMGETLRQVDLRAPIDTESLPAAMVVAVGEVGDRAEALRRQGREQLFRPRWLSSLYSTVEEAVAENLREEASAASGSTAVTRKRFVAEPGGGLDSRRFRFLEAVRRGRYRHLQDNELCRQLLHDLDGLNIDFVTEHVVPIAPGDSGVALPPATAWFSPPEDLPTLAGQLKPTVVRLSVTLADGAIAGGTGVLISEDGLIATARHVIDGALKVSVIFGSGDEMHEPAEIVAEARSTDVALVRAAPPAGARVANLSPVGRKIRQGEPVITLGHPLLQAGEPTLAWGLVTAVERTISIDHPPTGVGGLRVIQTTYQSAGGASGSPVFDLEGRVIAIHSAGSTSVAETARAQYMSFAVPIDEVQTLIALLEAGNAALPVQAALREPASSPEQPLAAVKATEFLRELIDVPETLSFLPGHWVDPTDGRALVVRPEPEPPDLDGDGNRLAELAGPTEFLSPVRVALHRVELAEAVPPEELRCTTARDAPGAADVVAEHR